MKTLDEVIKALECCIDPELHCNTDCPYEDRREGQEDMNIDALHYLREYQEKQKTLKIREAEYKRGFEQLGVEWSRLKDNPPLTWDELKTMEGKPVWFEWTGSPRWGIVDGIYTNAYGVENLVICIPHDYLHFDKRMQGQVWQAYRKETE